jgi:hypothetical protein
MDSKAKRPPLPWKAIRQITNYLKLRPHPSDIEEAAREIRAFMDWKAPHPDDNELGYFDERQPRLL